MGQTTGNDLKERVGVLTLARAEEEDRLVWTETRRTWAAAVQDDRRNLFSSVGVGARGVIFTLRSPPHLTLFQALRWRGMHCFLTAITGASPGFSTVKAALAEPVECVKDADREAPGTRFPGILTEKYVGHEQPDLHGEVTTLYVLVTPKEIRLAPGSWVTADGEQHLVLCPHELDPYKNEYEVRRRKDA